MGGETFDSVCKAALWGPKQKKARKNRLKRRSLRPDLVFLFLADNFIDCRGPGRRETSAGNGAKEKGKKKKK